MTWTRLPPVEGRTVCLTCGAGSDATLPPERLIAVGFGAAGYTCDGAALWVEDRNAPEDTALPTCADVEALAKADPDHDWRIFFYAAMYDAEYQRQGDGHWVLVRRGEGFA